MMNAEECREFFKRATAWKAGKLGYGKIKFWANHSKRGIDRGRVLVRVKAPNFVGDVWCEQGHKYIAFDPANWGCGWSRG
jgi:hypothetical protein